MGNIILHAVFRKFPFDRLIRAAGSISLGIPALDHKTADDPVEGQAVIESIARKPDKVGDTDRRGIRIQFQFNSAVILNLNLNMVKAFQIVFFLFRSRALFFFCTFRTDCVRLRSIFFLRSASRENGGK